MRVSEWLGNENQLGIDIWNKKYKFENETFDEWLNRVSNGDEKIAQLIKDKKFLFAGRILSNRGLDKVGKKITYSNCYVIPQVEDNIESIYDACSKLARTYSYSGGCGLDISKLRPRGMKVNNASNTTTGAVSFMDTFSQVTGTIGQNGRRGALMLSISCDHPDLEEFIEIKNDLTRVTKANISVRVSDEFMKAIEEDKEWELSFETEHGDKMSKMVNAKKLFRLLSKNNHSMAEPGILFWDRIENYNLLSEDPNFHYAGVNPCARP
jgi:ribonucleoside-diphosphate reductase alpha chain